jgi:hypothetical protein
MKALSMLLQANVMCGFETWSLFWLENVQGRDHLEDIVVDGKMLQCILGKWGGLDASGSGQGPVSGSCEHGNERSGSIKGGNLLD